MFRCMGFESTNLESRYYWTTIREDYRIIVQKSKKCQEFGNFKHLPSHELQEIYETCSFAK